MSRLREWIQSMPFKQKRAGRLLAGFFALMVIFTMLSRMADSFSVPTVTASTTRSGTLNHKITADGTVYADEVIPVMVPSGYLISRMLVNQGSQVHAGDTLAILDIDDVAEQLRTAQIELQKLQIQIGINNLTTVSTDEQYALQQAQTQLLRAQDDLERAQNETDIAVSNAQDDLYDARRVERKAEDAENDDEIEAAETAVRQARRTLRDALANQETAIENARRTVEDAELALEQAELKAEQAIVNAENEEQRTALENQGLWLDIELKQREINKLQSIIENGGVIAASCGGIVTKINAEVGAHTPTDSLFLIGSDEGSFYLRATVDKATADLVARGDTGEITISGLSTKVQNAVIESISASTEESGMYELTISFPGVQVEPGVSGEFSMLKGSVSYSQIIPLEALRTDSKNRNYVLILREKETILGTEIYAERVDVTVEERDKTHVAITSSLFYDDEVISNSSRSISEGDRVRPISG